MNRPKLVTDAVQQLTGAKHERKTYIALGKVAMFTVSWNCMSM